MAREPSDPIDALFQLPVEEFTAARNALAKQSGTASAAIRKLSKPPVAAWAVNQLYWRERKTYDALVEAAGELRRAHKAVLGGRAADLRAASRAHDQALDAAVKATLSILTASGHPASDATRQAIVTTLRALPAGEAPGRLTRTLQPGGFEALSGFSIATSVTLAPNASPGKQTTSKGSAKTKAAKDRETKAEKARAAKAIQALRLAEHEAKREEFERARAVREADKAAAAVERARAAVEAARQELEDAERAAQAAAEHRERAERRAAAAEQKVDAARAATSS